MSKHIDGAFEDGIEAHLRRNDDRTGNHSDYDRERALLIGELVGFIEDNQPKVWRKLRGIHKDELQDPSLNALGNDDLIRDGFNFCAQRDLLGGGGGRVNE